MIDQPATLPVTTAFVHGRERAVNHDAEKGVRVYWLAKPDRTEYLTAPDWTRIERHRPVARKLATAIRAA